MGVPPNATATGWEAGFIPEARGMQPPTGQSGVNQLVQSTVPSESHPSVTSTPAVGRGTRQMLKLPRYTGADSLETFLRKFNSMKQYLQWNEDDAMYHLCGSLEGAAGQVLEGLPTEAKTADVVKLLQTRFGTELQAERFKAELSARLRQPDETLQHLYREINRLVSLAHPAKSADFTDHVGKEAFIRALNNGPLQLKVLEGEPTNLEQALNLATKLEAYKSSLVSQGTLRRSPTNTSLSVKDKGKDPEPQLSPSELRDLLAQATKGIAALAAQSGEADKDKSGDKKLSPSKKNSGGRSSGRSKYRRYSGRKQDPKVDPCRNCNEMGHWAKDCPKPKQPANMRLCDCVRGRKTRPVPAR